MHRTALLAALALALGASGCWTNACIEQSSHGARCSEEVDGIITDSGDDEDGDDSADSCAQLKLGTTCRKEGYPYYCERDGYWYKYRCQ